MAIVAAPGRQFSTWSMRLTILIGTLDAAVILVNTLADPKYHVISNEVALSITAFIAFLIVPIRLYKQMIPVTPEERSEMVAQIDAMPTLVHPSTPATADEKATLAQQVADLPTKPPTPPEIMK